MAEIIMNVKEIKFQELFKRFTIWANQIFKLSKKEVKGFFTSPIAYVVYFIFVLIVVILLFGVYKYNQFGTTDLTQMFTFIAFTFIIIIPALTMGSISREKQSGTIEYILTQPLTEVQYIISKFFANLFLIAGMLVLTLPITLLISSFRGIDLGQVIMQYVGALTLASALISIGITISALFKSEIVSFIVSLIVSALFIITGSAILSTSVSGLTGLLDKFSLLTHYESISRGVLEFRDIIYFLIFIFIFLFIAYFLLVREKLPRGGRIINRLYTILVVGLILGLLVGYFGQLVPGKIDFTSAKRYSLSKVTQNSINNIQSNVIITLYASSNIPSQIQSTVTNLQDTIRDYVTSSRGKINFVLKQPDKDSGIESEAKSRNILQSQIGVKTVNSAQVALTYFGLYLESGSKNDTINFNLSDPTTLNFEYQITKSIRKISGGTKKTIDFVSNNSTNSRTSDLTILNGLLGDSYTINDIVLDKSTGTIPNSISAIILTTPSAAFDPEAITSLKKYFQDGGSIFLMNNGVISQNQTTAIVNKSSLGTLFSDYGVTVNNDLVYDLSKNNIISIQSDLGSQLIRYPLFISAIPINNVNNDSTGILKNITQVPLLLASDLSIDQSKVGNNKIYTILTTSNKSNIKINNALTTDPLQNWTYSNSDGTKVVAVGLENEKGGRVFIIGDSHFITDPLLQYLQQLGQQTQNTSFMINAVSWLAKDDSLGGIQNNAAPLLSLEDLQSNTLIISSILIPSIGLILVGGLQVYSRRKVMNKKYTPSNTTEIN